MTAKKQSGGFSVSVSILLIMLTLSLYPLSFGPACWMLDRGVVSLDAFVRIYKPLVRYCPSQSVHDALMWYGGLGCKGKNFTMLTVLIATTIEPETGGTMLPE